MRLGLLLLLIILLISIFARDFVLFVIAVLIYIGAKVFSRRGEGE